MPFASNPFDGVPIYFEDWGGSGAAVVLYTGFLDPIEVAQASGISRALRAEFRWCLPITAGTDAPERPTSPRRTRCRHGSPTTSRCSTHSVSSGRM